MKTAPAIAIQTLSKKFGQQTAVDRVSFNVEVGEVFALLGPNGAGKTTILRMLTTLLKPTSGTIQVLGHNLQSESQAVRSLFGLAGQYASVDEDLTARENLQTFSLLNGLTFREARLRTQELLEEFSLINSADKPLATFSGGMRRRLDLSISLIARPKIIFLDEPTTGLDPRTREQMWKTIRQLVQAGTTVILTTQYLEEADQLADHIALIDHGKLVALGTPQALKEKIASKKLNLTFQNELQATQAVQAIAEATNGIVQQTNNMVNVSFNEVDDITKILTNLQVAKLSANDIQIKQPSLDDVFFAMTVGKN
ncbi:ATP-binding cassette domain-containing protein [Pediococcus pentosaceus]|jgi:ABC-2 type transport system ATP-binding protein|uniref:ATP-binding cassette domain-containing protein n=1 Tax=Pediococcus pentosaceus TaxID=1255 RepID=A0A6L5A201_PEDPE|nr:ATP-binding cassette domain-containing protein [Pediococcus pentosaceus]KAF0413601.1 ATP-binding cassette domain-containing protein [Pediococcus pentosaceus]KAF0503915.1 ATP-binding cassette domain-containing protein [Pediococcus pentosaceus]MBF7120293.1 ATP-binding cassette domain-containing protein [Pediococcus pentosaceus]MBF7127305.1 ATP-binding cassette domain-containing protein [Pediococcus pentosaceus]MCG7196890.1 ATP-binding cassette domain-containing protein [Pediococcus pentosaceu